ncbi:hypothetical protein [Novilysobacter erysipheiresistens]|uniref:Uncharacterized protein n=1 Tax=Novilysobacter erysipheiresistens TaxID=1749332 RepID=A0ABU7YY57_9GAMM
MKLQATLLAIALGSLFSASAFAAGDDADLYTSWYTTNTIDVDGDVFVDGDIWVDGESAAVVDQDQLSLLSLMLGDGDNFASVEDNAMRGAFGNIQANVAAGAGNLQANDAALSAIDADNVFASAMVFNSQATGANIATDFPSGPVGELIYDAHVGDDALRDASGNIGLNVAAGAGNAQTNALAASVNSSGAIAKASADSEQLSVFNVVLALRDIDNTASIDGNALADAIGNIGVNVASGAGNAQHNGTAIAVGGGL